MLTHLGIIADGNRRWAKEQGLPTIKGHEKGIAAIETLIAAAAKLEIPYVTFYVFSTENWGRSADEVGYLMKMAETRILKLAEKMAKNNVRFLVLGARTKVPKSLAKKLDEAEELTRECTGTTACFCFNYGGEQEIADAATAAMRAVVNDDGALEAMNAEITPEMIRENLYHPEVPNVDMVVRTSGEQRTSGFMLWRAAYAELMFIEKYFPEMTAEDLAAVLEEYENRNRRFGK